MRLLYHKHPDPTDVAGFREGHCLAGVGCADMRIESSGARTRSAQRNAGQVRWQRSLCPPQDVADEKSERTQCPLTFQPPIEMDNASRSVEMGHYGKDQ